MNPEQLEAVNTINGPLLVIAGAGSGKTRVVTHRIVHLLEKGIPASEILGVTFTNKAAGEMQERVRKLTHASVLVSTFHSLGARILRESIEPLGYGRDFTIYDEDDTEKILKSCLEEMNVPSGKKETKPFRSIISRAKNALMAPGEEEAPLPVYERYQKKLKECNALDFDDLLYLPVKLWREFPKILEHYQNRWRYLLIDEYQDTNKAQYELVRMLVAKSCNLCVVGDPDQSIYSWRGANIENILNFESDFPGAKVIRLEQNYRSRTNILNAANGLIRHNRTRYDKALWSDRGAGDKIKSYTAWDDKEEASFVVKQILHHEKQNIPLRDMVIFYRTNSQSRILEDFLLSRHIPYVIVGGVSFYQRMEIKDILGFLRMVHSGTDYVSFVRTINLPKRGLGESSLGKLRAGALLENVPIFEYCKSFENQLPPKQKAALQGYVTLIENLRRIKQETSLTELVKDTIRNSGYIDHLRTDPETFDDRKSNVEELIAKANEWEFQHPGGSLQDFLEELSLKSSLDEAKISDDRVNLMTLHNGKGLEYTVAFLVGLEEDLLPHLSAKDEPSQVEEERRLCYVGMTRAKEFLYLTNASSRFLWGSARSMAPSRFLKELPLEYIERVRRGS